MNKLIESVLSDSIVVFTSDDHYSDVLAAKKVYSDLTGRIDSDSSDFEIRMSFFNAWYLFNYKIDGTNTVIEKYIEQKSLKDSLAESLKNSNFSVFTHAGQSLTGKTVLRDLLNDKKLVLPKEHGAIPVIKGDLFLGRTIDFEENTYLLPEFCLLPEDAITVIKKKAKLIRKSEDVEALKYDFLMETENLKNRYKNYTHVPAKKFFEYKTI